MSLSKMSLLDIPDLPMIKILKDCDFNSLLCLRKTCHNLRNFIDYLAPEAKTDIINIDVTVYSDNIEMRLGPDLPFDIVYRKCSQGCKLEIFEYRDKKNWSYYDRLKKAPKYIANADFMDAFCTDLSGILRMQGTKMDALTVSMCNYRKKEPKILTRLLSYLGCVSESSSKPEFIHDGPDKVKDLISMCNRIYDIIEISLRSRPRPLRVGRLDLSVTDKRQYLQVLPYTDPTVLDALNVFCIHKNKIDLEIDDLMKMNHWKNIKDLSICGFKLKGRSIEDFGHLKRGNVILDVGTVNDVLFLKEKFLNTPDLGQFFLNFTSLENLDSLNEVIGFPIQQDPVRWEFLIPENNQCIYVWKYKNCFRFERHTIHWD